MQLLCTINAFLFFTFYCFLLKEFYPNVFFSSYKNYFNCSEPNSKTLRVSSLWRIHQINSHKNMLGSEQLPNYFKILLAQEKLLCYTNQKIIYRRFQHEDLSPYPSRIHLQTTLYHVLVAFLLHSCRQL
jgi:hypothetical protein